MKLNEIKELIDKVNEAGIGELKLEQGDFKINIRSKAYVEATQKKQVIMGQPTTMQMPQAGANLISETPPVSNAVQPVASETPDTSASADTNLITVKAPMIGTFYRSSSPEKPPFVKVGDDIAAGDTICIIEAMKLFNEIESEVSGKVVKILVDDASPVEYDQPVMLVEPV